MTTITVTIWHNVARDQDGRPTGMLEGYQPGDPVVRVFTYQADPAGRAPEQIAEEAFAICNGHPADARGADLARRYYERELRSLSVGDIVAVGEVGLAVGRAGWTLVRGGLNEVRISEHGTRPLPAPAPDGARLGDPSPIPPGRSRTGHECP
jgi:hypothetical protein